MPTTQEESYKRKMKRVKANDPVAMNETGMIMRDVHRNYEKAVEYFTKAAALGESSAHYNLACLYNHGLGVERDAKKEFYHMEEAAIGGHPVARYNLGYYEGRSGRIDRAMKHFIISAKLGYDEALEEVKKGFQMGDVSKEDYAAALRGHQAAVDATKSAQRNAAEEYYDPSQDMRRMVQSLAQAQD
jgi:TPR repeat protein